MGPRALIRATLTGLLGIVACNTKQHAASSQRVESLAALSTELNLKFPASARLLGVMRSNGMDDAVQVKVELAAGELPSLVAQAEIPPGMFIPGTGGMLGPDEGFWDPHAVPSLRTGQTDRPGARVLNLGIDDSRPDVAVIYIMEHGT